MPIKSFRGVQAVRFATALVVVLFHACYWYNRDAGAGGQAPTLELLGDMCVWTFFLISGFVVTHVVDSGREPDWSTFAVRRAVRILPLAWSMTAVKIVAAIAIPNAMFDGGLNAGRIVSSFLLIPTRDPDGHFRTLWGVEWTLVFEAAFYAAVAVCIAARVDPVRFLTPILVAVSVLAVWRPEGGSITWFYADPVLLFLAAGMVLSRAHREGRPFSGMLWLSGLAVVFAVIRALTGASGAIESAAVFLLVSGVFAVVIASERRIGARIPAWLVTAGEASFAIYLTHPLVAQLLPRLLGLTGVTGVPWWAVVSVSVAISVLFGLAVHRWLDAPFGRVLRRRFVPRKPSVPARTPDRQATA